MTLFVKNFIGEVREWFKALTRGILLNWDELEDIFLINWGSKVNHIQALNKYNKLKKSNNESIQDFSKRFNKA